MSKLKSATIAAVCALGASAAMITPASAVGTANATYNCGIYGNPVTVQFTRTTQPPANNLTVKAFLTFFSPSPIPVGGVVATLKPPPGPPYPVVATNKTLVPAGLNSSITLTGPAPVALPGPPAIISIKITPPGITVTCTLIGPVPPGTWPI